ncbi:MAG: tetratricopeptide repeat protein [Bdellovibrionales bacterium]|nr:tetratricopeptide repeat protein [Bdellovibrionales bacterium]
MNLPIDSATLDQWHAIRLRKEDIAVEYEKLNRSVKEAIGVKDKNRLMGLLETALSFRHGTGYYTAGILLGEILIEKAQFAKAIEVSQKIKLDHPAYPEAYRLESEAYIQTNQLALAKATLAEGLIYSPDDPGLKNLHKAIPIQ